VPLTKDCRFDIGQSTAAGGRFSLAGLWEGEALLPQFHKPQLGKSEKTVKRILMTAAAFVGLFSGVTLISNLTVRADSNDRDRSDRDREDEEKLEIQQGFKIAPVPLNLKDKDVELVGLGSYIVNAQSGCNDCHTCPSYKPPNHNPFPVPFGSSGDGQVNDVGYLAGGVDFGPPPAMGGVTSANITPDATGKPGGLTLEQFQIALRTGHDPLDPKNGLLAVMPWPAFRHLTGRDLDAIYAYLTAIPSATPPPVGMHCKNPGQ